VITIPKPYGQTHGRTYGLTDRQTTCRSITHALRSVAWWWGWA